MRRQRGRPPAPNGDLSYGMRLGRALSAQAQLVCYGGRGLIRDWRGRRDVPNAPQFFDLAVVDELPRLHPRATWDHAAYLPDVVVVSLGTNDFNLALGTFPEREEFVAAYVAFARAIRARYPRAAIILTEGAIVSDDDDPAAPAEDRAARRPGRDGAPPRRPARDRLPVAALPGRRVQPASDRRTARRDGARSRTGDSPRRRMVKIVRRKASCLPLTSHPFVVTSTGKPTGPALTGPAQLRSNPFASAAPVAGGELKRASSASREN